MKGNQVEIIEVAVDRVDVNPFYNFHPLIHGTLSNEIDFSENVLNYLNVTFHKDQVIKIEKRKKFLGNVIKKKEGISIE